MNYDETWCRTQITHLNDVNSRESTLVSVIEAINELSNEKNEKTDYFFNKFLPNFFNKLIKNNALTNMGDPILSIYNNLCILSCNSYPKLSNLVFLLTSCESPLWKDRSSFRKLDEPFRNHLSEILDQVIDVLSNPQSIFDFELFYTLLINKTISIDDVSVITERFCTFLSTFRDIKSLEKLDATALSNIFILISRHENSFGKNDFFDVFIPFVKLSMETYDFERQLFAINIIEKYLNRPQFLDWTKTVDLLSLLNLCKKTDIIGKFSTILNKFIKEEDIDDNMIIKFLNIVGNNPYEQEHYHNLAVKFISEKTNQETKEKIVDEIEKKQSFNIKFIIYCCRIDAKLCELIIKYITNNIKDQKCLNNYIKQMEMIINEFKGVNIEEFTRAFLSIITDVKGNIYSDFLKQCLILYQHKLNLGNLENAIFFLFKNNEIQTIIDIFQKKGFTLATYDKWLNVIEQINEECISVESLHLLDIVLLNSNRYSNFSYYEKALKLYSQLYEYKNDKKLSESLFTVVYHAVLCLPKDDYLNFWNNILEEEYNDNFLIFLNYMSRAEMKLYPKKNNLYSEPTKEENNERFMIYVYTGSSYIKLMVENSTLIAQITDFLSMYFKMGRYEALLYNGNACLNPSFTVKESCIYPNSALSIYRKRERDEIFTSTHSEKVFALNSLSIFRHCDIDARIIQCTDFDIAWSLISNFINEITPSKTIDYRCPALAKLRIINIINQNYFSELSEYEVNKLKSKILNGGKRVDFYRIDGLKLLCYKIPNDRDLFIYCLETKGSKELIDISLSYAKSYIRRNEDEIQRILDDKSLCEYLIDTKLENGDCKLMYLLKNIRLPNELFKEICSFIDFGNKNRMQGIIQLLSMIKCDATYNFSDEEELINYIFDNIDDDNQNSFASLLKNISDSKEDKSFLKDYTEKLCSITTSFVNSQYYIYPIIRNIYNNCAQKQQEIEEYYAKNLEIVVKRFSQETVKKDMFKGLRNLGSTCYMNAVMQQLFFNKEFRNQIFNYEIKEDDKKGKMVLGIKNLFLRMKYCNTKFCDTGDFFKCFPSFGNHEQKDAFEFFDFLFSELPDSFSDDFLCKYSVIFEGLTKEFVQVNECKSLHITLYVGEYKTFEEALASLDSPTYHTGGDKFDHPEFGKVDACQKEILKELPDTLVFQLARFVYSNGQSKKLNNRFPFPLKFDSSLYSECGKEYVLTGIVIHTGKTFSGHYFSIIKIDDEWYRFDDTNVEKIENFEPENYYGNNKSVDNESNAYMLFYSAILDEEIKDSDGDNEEIIKEIEEENKAYRTTQCNFSNNTRDFIVSTFNENSCKVLLAYFLNVSMQTSCNISDKIDKVLKTHPLESVQYFTENAKKIVDYLITGREYISELIVNYLLVLYKTDLTCEELFPLVKNISFYMNKKELMWRSYPLFGEIIYSFVSISKDHSKIVAQKSDIIQNFVGIIDNFYSTYRDVAKREVNFTKIFKSIIICSEYIDTTILKCLSKHINDIKLYTNENQYNDFLMLCYINRNKDINSNNSIANKAIKNISSFIFINAVVNENENSRIWAEESLDSTLGIAKVCDDYIKAEIVHLCTKCIEFKPFTDFPNNSNACNDFLEKMHNFIIENCNNGSLSNYNLVIFARCIAKLIACGGTPNTECYVAMLKNYNKSDPKFVLEVLRIFMQLNKPDEIKMNELLPLLLRKDFTSTSEKVNIFNVFVSMFISSVSIKDLLESENFVSFFEFALKEDQSIIVKYVVDYFNNALESNNEVGNIIAHFIEENAGLLVYRSSVQLCNIIKIKEVENNLTDAFGLNLFRFISNNIDKFSLIQHKNNICKILCQKKPNVSETELKKWLECSLKLSNIKSLFNVALNVVHKRVKYCKVIESFIDSYESEENFYDTMLWKFKGLYAVANPLSKRINNFVFNFIEKANKIDAEGKLFFFDCLTNIMNRDADWTKMIYLFVVRAGKPKETEKFVEKFENKL